MNDIGPAEAIGTALEIIENLKLPSRSKVLVRILEDLDLSDEGLDGTIEALKTLYAGM